MPATCVPMTQSQWKVCPQTYKHLSEYFEVVASNECISTLFFPPQWSHTHARTHTHRRIVLHYESRTSYAITSDNSCYFCLSLLVLLMITCMNTYLLSPNHCYNWAPCLGVRLSWLTRSDVSQVTLACKHLASFTFDIQLLWNCGLAKPRGVNRETGSDPCRVSQLV